MATAHADACVWLRKKCEHNPQARVVATTADVDHRRAGWGGGGGGMYKLPVALQIITACSWPSFGPDWANSTSAYDQTPKSTTFLWRLVPQQHAQGHRDTGTPRDTQGHTNAHAHTQEHTQGHTHTGKNIHRLV